MTEVLPSPAYEDLKQNTAYKVVDGRNSDFWPNVMFWVDPRDGAVCIAGKNGGWLEKDEISDDLFSGIKVAEAQDFYIATSFSCGGGSRLMRRA